MILFLFAFNLLWGQRAISIRKKKKAVLIRMRCFNQIRGIDNHFPISMDILICISFGCSLFIQIPIIVTYGYRYCVDCVLFQSFWFIPYVFFTFALLCASYDEWTFAHNIWTFHSLFFFSNNNVGLMRWTIILMPKQMRNETKWNEYTHTHTHTRTHIFLFCILLI